MKTLDQTTFSSDLLSQLFSFASHIWRPKLFLAGYIFAVIHYNVLRKRNNQLTCWPVLGMFPSFLLALKTGIHEFITDALQNSKGTFTLKGPWFSNFDHVATSDPSNLEHILKTNFFNYRKGQSTRAVMHEFLGEGIFNMDGKKWILLRKTAGAKLRVTEFNKFTMESWDELVQSRLLPVAEDLIKQSVAFDLQDLLLRLVFDHSCIMAFGVDPGYLTHGLPDLEFPMAFRKVEEVTALRFYLPVFIWKPMRYLNMGWEKEMKKSIEQVNDFAYKVIAKRRMELSDKPSDGKSRSDYLSILMESKEDNGNCYGDKFLRDICCNLMFGGTDTTAVSLSWFFWQICQSPMVEEKIYAEICQIVGKKHSYSIFGTEEVKKMHYLHAALTEALRLYPPVPLNRLEVYNDDQFPNGVKLKKGTKVVYSIYAMGRTESIWGKDCREFKPERWLKDGEFVAESPYKFPAFNAGLRTCLGKDLAYHHMKGVVASIIYRYKITLVENHSVVPKLSPMLHMKYGLKVTFSRRVERESSH